MSADVLPRRALTLVGAGVSLLVAHNARVLLRVRDGAQQHDHGLVHDRVVGPDGAAPLRLAVLGDSAATGFGLDDADLAWPGQLARRIAHRTGRPVEVRCVAVRGHRIRTVVDEQLDAIVGWDPDVVLVSAGGNDVLGRRVPSLVRRDMHALVDGLEAVAPRAVIFVGGPSDLGAAPVLPQPVAALLTWWTDVVAETQRRVADARGVAFGRLPRIQPEHFGPDRFHPGAVAHAMAAEMAVAAIEGRLAPLAAPHGVRAGRPARPR